MKGGMLVHFWGVMVWVPPLLKVVGWLVCLRSLGVSHYQDTITLTTRHVCTMVSLPISAGP